VAGTVEYSEVARILVTNFIFLAPILMALRRWRLPFGSVTLVWTVVAAGLQSLSEFQTWATVIAAFVGGLAADICLTLTNRSGRSTLGCRLLGGFGPLALWGAYFLALGVVHHDAWPGDLYLGTMCVAAMTGLALSFVAEPIADPASPRSAARR
jgi:hypothetical protein